MMHEEFAERFAERLEARADALEHGVRPTEQGATANRAIELRTAAAMAREEAAAVTEEEAPPPEAQA
jgi:CBS-domain-containing membrane protein